MNGQSGDAAPQLIQDLAKFKLPTNFRGRPAWFVQFWWLVQVMLFATSPQVCYGWRRFLLRIFGARIAPKVLLRPSARITYPWKLSVGSNSWIGDNVELYSLDQITIGSNVVISQGCYLCTGSHDYRSVDFGITISPITVESQAWLAAQSFIAPGVTIGQGAVVGARSLVLKNIPAFSRAFGHPAKVVGTR